MRHDVTIREAVLETPAAPDDRIGVILERLEAVYGVPDWTPRQDPLDELVACILSQNTSDTNSFRAFAQLKRRFPTMQQVMEAPTAQLADTIRSGGLADTKAPRIQNVLRSLQEERGRLSLDFLTLCRMPRRAPGCAACRASARKRQASCSASRWAGLFFR